MSGNLHLPRWGGVGYPEDMTETWDRGGAQNSKG